MDDRFIRRIIYTCDENGSITATLMPRNSDSVPVSLPKLLLKNRFGPKVMLCVWWNFEGVIHSKFVPNGRAIDAGFYHQQLERIREILKLRYSALVNRNRVLLQQDNARPHTARTQTFVNWEEWNCYLTQHTAMILRLQIIMFRSMKL